MPEVLRDFEVTITLTTNKNTYKRKLDSIDEAQDVLTQMKNMQDLGSGDIWDVIEAMHSGAGD